MKRRPPEFYDPEKVGTLYQPDFARIAKAAAAADLPAASEDPTKRLLLFIDMQVDFCHESGALYVPGALDDIRRLIGFIVANADRITSIACTADSHVPLQIFHPGWWRDRDGNPPPPFTTITEEEVRNGTWIPIRDPDWALSYVRQLKARAKKELLVWPYHGLIGGIGHALDPTLWSVVMWHSLARRYEPYWRTKGRHPLTEHYSAFGPELPPPGNPPDPGRQEFMEHLSAYDHLFVAGEASSHCVQETLKDLVETSAGDRETLRRVMVLRDCTSPVQHPEIDFEALTRQQFEQFAAAGIVFLSSTDPLPE